MTFFYRAFSREWQPADVSVYILADTQLCKTSTSCVVEGELSFRMSSTVWGPVRLSWSAFTLLGSILAHEMLVIVDSNVVYCLWSISAAGAVRMATLRIDFDFAFEFDFYFEPLSRRHALSLRVSCQSNNRDGLQFVLVTHLLMYSML